MAWNISNKSLNGQGGKSLIGPGAPVSANPSFVGRAYRDPWDIERAYREGMQKVTWVARCIDAIAGNQARLPVILRKENSPIGRIVRGDTAAKSSLLTILNTKSNIGENAYIFRYRLSSQILLGTRGAFIEKVRGRDGSIIGLNLLPPQSTAPIPDPIKFVSGYEVLMPTGEKIIMNPDDVIWVRRPHPLDPYLSLTPMESAGIAIEIENLAKLYNRNYLLNDGRPGGLLVLRGEIDDDDKDELRNRFRGNLGRVGSTSVISADDGVDYVDTSSNPRDAAYIQMRQITKEEILASFGVPESVIGNASGRTFSNAAEEVSVFWNETMSPHLEILARALDDLDAEHYVDFDTSDVPYLIITKQERERYLLDEQSRGLISVNEYREGTGRKKVESELADSLLMNPNLTPIANTTKPTPPPGQGGVPMGGGAPGVPGMPPGMPPGAPGMPPGADGAPAPDTMAGALMAEQGGIPGAPAGAPGGFPGMGMPGGGVPGGPEGAMGQMSDTQPLAYKDEGTERDTAIVRWEEILDRSLERVLERQQRVVLEKVGGKKARDFLSSGSLDSESILNSDTWTKQMDEDIRPVLSAILKDSKSIYAEKSADYSGPSASDVHAHLDAQMTRIKCINDDTRSLLDMAIFNSFGIKNEEERLSALKTSIVSIYTDLLVKVRPEIASSEARRAWDYCRP